MVSRCFSVVLTSQDYILLVLTVASAALRNPFAVLRTALPYISLLGLFTSFVVWNGSVVLGKILVYDSASSLLCS